MIRHPLEDACDRLSRNIGVALRLDMAMRPVRLAGARMLVLMWSASVTPQNDRFFGEHIIVAILLIGLV